MQNDVKYGHSFQHCNHIAFDFRFIICDYCFDHFLKVDFFGIIQYDFESIFF